MKRSITVFLALLFSGTLFASPEFSIRFYDKRIYVPGSPVMVKVSLRNESPLPWRFKLADDKMFSIVFDVRTQSNRALEPSDLFIRNHSRNQPVYFREVAIEPGEEYSFVADVAEYVKVQEPALYTVTCRLYPELGNQQAASGSPARTSTAAIAAPLPAGAGSVTPASVTPAWLESNRLLLSVQPDSGVSPARRMIAEDKKSILKAEAVSPDEVVRRTIEARQKGNWNEFFLYLDLEAMLTTNTAKRRVFERESDEGRRRMIERFRDDLSRSTIDTITTIPVSFEILQTKYGPVNGEVVALERFKYPTYTQRMEYHYFLKRVDSIWYIQDYTVVDKGTE